MPEVSALIQQRLTAVDRADRLKSIRCLCIFLYRQRDVSKSTPTFRFDSFETPERVVVFDDSTSGMAYMDTNRDMCTTELHRSGDGGGTGVTSCLQLKSEPSSPESTSDLLLASGSDDCAGCGRLIQVR